MEGLVTVITQDLAPWLVLTPTHTAGTVLTLATRVVLAVFTVRLFLTCFSIISWNGDQGVWQYDRMEYGSMSFPPSMSVSPFVSGPSLLLVSVLNISSTNLIRTSSDIASIPSLKRGRETTTVEGEKEREWKEQERDRGCSHPRISLQNTFLPSFT